MSNKSEKSFLGDVKDSLTKPFRPKKEKVKKAAPEQRREASGASGDVTCEGPSTSKQGHHAHDIQGENSLPPPDPQLAALAENNSLVQTARDELLLRENPLPSQDLQLEVLSGNNSLIEPAPGEVSQGENPPPPQDPQLAALPGNNNVNEPAAPNEIHPAENLVPSERELNVIAEQGPGIFNSLGQKDGEHLDEQSDSLSAVSGPNEDAHQPRNGDQPDIRPNLLTQNSCYEQPSEFRDEEDAPYGVTETASPKRTTPPSTAQTEDLSVLQEGLPTTGTSTSRISSLPAKLEHFKPDSLVKDKIVCKVQITDVLSLHLDRSVCPGRREVPLMQRWEHLADVLEVPDEMKRQCENFTGKLSPSECMFEHLCLTNDSLSIEVLKYQLGEIKRKDVADELNNNSSLSADEATVTDLCNDHPETLNAVCLKLDDMRGPINWYHLGMKLGIPGGTLRTFRDPSGCSPSEVILQKIASLHPNLSITIIADAVEKEVPAVVKVLNELPAGSTIKTLLNNLDVLDKVTALLDLQESSWMHFGAKFKIDRKVLDSLKPDPIRSPTKVLMECLVQNDPDLTMATFLKSLEKIERYDVIEELTKFFYREDIDAIFRG